MKGIFHSRVPSFTLTRPKDKDNSHHETRLQPSSGTPVRAEFSFSSRSSPTGSTTDLDPTQLSTTFPDNSLDVHPSQSDQADVTATPLPSAFKFGRRRRAGSLVDGILEDGGPMRLLGFPPGLKGRRGSANDAGLAIEPRTGSGLSINNSNGVKNSRKRLSSLFGGHRRASSSPSASPTPSPSPSPSNYWFKTSTSNDRLSVSGVDSDGESVVEVTPGNFNQSSDEDEDSSGSDDSSITSRDSDNDTLDGQQLILANTTANASSRTPIDYLQSSDQPVPFIDQAPNLTSPPPTPIPFASSTRQIKSMARKASLSKSSSMRRKRSFHGVHVKLPLEVSRPIYERNRCTITLEHGDRAKAFENSQRTRFYLVASDLSEESKYAIEWTIGTVLRQGDECLIITVIETETKFDPKGPASAADKLAKIKNQQDRREKAAFLVREATALLERTALNVKVTCQAVHAKNAKHMLIDCIDFLNPDLVIVSRHGINSAKGTLMGGTCAYIVQKSSVPVMVARRKLRVQPKVYKKKSQLNRDGHMQLHQSPMAKDSQRLNLDEQPNLMQSNQPLPQQNTMDFKETQGPPDEEHRSPHFQNDTIIATQTEITQPESIETSCREAEGGEGTGDQIIDQKSIESVGVKDLNTTFHVEGNCSGEEIQKSTM